MKEEDKNAILRSIRGVANIYAEWQPGQSEDRAMQNLAIANALRSVADMMQEEIEEDK